MRRISQLVAYCVDYEFEDVVSSVTGEGLRELRSAIDDLAARVVPETKANRPVVAEAYDAYDADASDTDALAAG